MSASGFIKFSIFFLHQAAFPEVFRILDHGGDGALL